ncbi:MAG: hypothetical protein QOJ83_1985, partial [Frankiales bacterium]|nr:hypothetical protein [Frankiales bacterium]
GCGVAVLILGLAVTGARGKASAARTAGSLEPATAVAA